MWSVCPPLLQLFFLLPAPSALSAVPAAPSAARLAAHTPNPNGKAEGRSKEAAYYYIFFRGGESWSSSLLFFYRQTHSALFRPQHALSFKAFTRVLRPLIRFSSSHKAARNAIDPRLVASSVNHGGAGEVNRSCPVLKHRIETLIQVLHSDEWAE